MNQTGDSSNFVQIGDAGHGNTYKMVQRTAVGPSYAQLEIDKDSIQRHPKAKVEKQALRGGIIVAIGLVPGFTASFADLLGILSYFGIPRFSTIVVSLPVGLVLATLSSVILGENFDSLDYWIRSRFLKSNEPKRIGLAKFLEVDDKGDYLIYWYAARCIYPRCNGKIFVEKLPPREQHRDGLAGVCAVAGTAHSYLIDSNLVATPKDLNWSPQDPPSYNPSYRR